MSLPLPAPPVPPPLKCLPPTVTGLCARGREKGGYGRWQPHGCCSPEADVTYTERAVAAAATAPMEAREPLRELRQALRAVLARVREGEPGEGREAFELPRFWDALGQTFKVTSQEATKLSLAFSRPSLTSAEDCQKLSEDVQNAILAVATVYYWLPKGQGTTLRKMVRDATTEVVEGMIQLTETILSAPLESLSQEQLISTGGVWEACEQVSNLPRDNQAAVVSTLTACLGVVKDALEEMEHALVEGQDPYSDIMEDEELGFRGNRDTYWSEADRKLLSSCMGLMKASKACLKKVLSVVKAYGKADSPEQIAQLDDVADIANEISPSVDELALSMYPPMNQLAVRLNGKPCMSTIRGRLGAVSNWCSRSQHEQNQELHTASNLVFPCLHVLLPLSLAYTCSVILSVLQLPGEW
ncbi:cyclin-D1-binding protein 1 isoform X2 [Heliangelus exortis]|uniref:cyclin-D1-binding protein 1 isoform X2 n=1 Tax=Heliangelus exortis TaxID=472823 RepID=UPI003A8F45F5